MELSLKRRWSEIIEHTSKSLRSSYTKSNDERKTTRQLSVLELGEDILLEITSHIDAISVLRFLSSSKRFGTLKQKSVIIERIAPYKRFIITKHWNAALIAAVSKSNLAQIQYFISKGADDINNSMKEAAQNGNLRLVEYFIDRGASRWNVAMQSACIGGHKHLVDYFITKGANDWKKGFDGAVKGGHRDLVHFFLDKQPDQNWNSAIIHSQNEDLIKEHFHRITEQFPRDRLLIRFAKDGNKPMVEFCFQHGSQCSLNWALDAASRSGNSELIDYFIKKGADGWNRGLAGAVQGGQKSVVELMIRLGASDYDNGLVYAAEINNRELVDFFIMKGGCNFNGALRKASFGGHKEMGEYLITLGARDWEGAFEAAAENAQTDLVEFFMEKITRRTLIDWNTMMKYAVLKGHRYLVELFVSEGATNLDLGLFLAVKLGYPQLAEFFVEKGAKDLDGALAVATQAEDITLSRYLVGKGAKKGT